MLKKSKLKHFLSLLVVMVLFTCAACSNFSSNRAQVEQHLSERKAYWQYELDTLPTGANQAQAESWLKAHDLPVKAYDNKYQISLDKIPVEGELLPVCDAWFVNLTITLNAEGKVAAKEVAQLGSCL